MISKNTPEYNELLKACLDKFEEYEIQMLAWGDTGSFFTQTEVLVTIRQVLNQFAVQRQSLNLMSLLKMFFLA